MKNLAKYLHDNINCEINFEFLEIINSGADLNSKCPYGRTALMIAIVFHYNKIAKFLIRAGADIDIKDKNGKDIFYYAKSAHNVKIYKYLLKKKAQNIKKSRKKNNELLKQDYEFMVGDLVKIIDHDSYKDDQFYINTISGGMYDLNTQLGAAYPRYIAAGNELKLIKRNKT